MVLHTLFLYLQLAWRLWLPLRYKGLRTLAATIVCVVGAAGLHAAEPTQIRVPAFDAPRDGRPGYFFEVLDLALSKTLGSHGPYQVTIRKEVMSLDRALTDLRNGHHLDLVFTAHNPGLTNELRPIPISLLKELNNYRILLIRDGEQARFDGIQTLNELRTMTAGLGLQWVDTKIMRQNGFAVEGSTLHDSLFKMLAAKRFDFFPRGIYEIQSDFAKYKDLGLVIEKNLLLHYEAPFYFFVNSSNTKLANRIEAGLKIALADGSFDRLLTSYPEFKAAMEVQHTTKRRLLRLSPLPASCWTASQPRSPC
jgi:hypothetical protein